MHTHHILWTGAIPWLMVAELFLQEARPIAVTIATIVNWLSNFAVALAFPQILVSHMTTDSQSKWVIQLLMADHVTRITVCKSCSITSHGPKTTVTV